MSNELALNRGIGEKLMSIGIGKSSPKKVAAQNHEGTPIKEREPRALDFFGWDVDGTAVDTMDDFRRIDIDVVVTKFGEYGVTAYQAGLWYDNDRSAAGTRFVEDVGRFHGVPKEVIKEGVVEVRKRLSEQLGNPIPHIAEIMEKLKEKEIFQFVCTNANREDAIRKLEFAGLLQHLDKEAIFGADSGLSGEVLLKGEPQLRRLAEYYKSRGIVKGYSDFVGRAGYLGDMVRDMREMLPCGLRLLIGFADKATSVQRMLDVGGRLTGDRFRVVTIRNIQDVVGYINIINRVEASRI